MGMKTRAAAAVLVIATAAACGRFGGGSGGGDGAAGGQETQAAREDSARATAKALQDSGVSVDTQTIDTGTAAAARADDN